MSVYEPLCSGTKKCGACGEALPALMFPADKRNRDGLGWECRGGHRRRCTDERRRQRHSPPPTYAK